MPNHLLKLYAQPTTPRTWRVVTMPNAAMHPETTLVEVLECPESEAVDRAYAIAKERGFTIDGHTVDINALML
jgi:hypothetical protein